MKRISFEEIFMETARLFAKRSTCCRKKVGGVLVKDNRIICCGYNGTPHNSIHCDDVFKDEIDHSDLNFMRKHKEFSDKQELHCEQNIISYCARNGIMTNGTTLFLTLSPCSGCAKLIYTAGISRVVYDEHYDRPEIDGVEFLRDRGIYVLQFKHMVF